MTPIPLSLYIHIPWCIKKCPYCDFNSHEARKEVPEVNYINALLHDLESALPQIWGRSIESVFIGGGTPSLFSAEGINRLLAGLRERLPIRPNIEITLEANPSTFEQERFDGFREAGINRLSIGIQSFNNEKLKSLGRVHGAEEALLATEISKKAGFENINLDLMFGLPQQSVDESLNDLNTAIDMSPNHISWYQLTIEENTFFHHSPPLVPHDETIWEMQKQGQQLLKSAGYQQYEISAYAQNNQHCIHNINYWEFGDYLGIGAGAHGKITHPDGSISRHTKYRHPEKYIQMANEGKAESSNKVLDEKDRTFEFMLNASRLKKGFTESLFERRTFLEFTKVEKEIKELINQGLLEKHDERYKTTAKGWLFVNDIVNRFL